MNQNFWLVCLHKFWVDGRQPLHIGNIWGVRWNLRIWMKNWVDDGLFWLLLCSSSITMHSGRDSFFIAQSWCAVPNVFFLHLSVLKIFSTCRFISVWKRFCRIYMWQIFKVFFPRKLSWVNWKLNCTVLSWSITVCFPSQTAIPISFWFCCAISEEIQYLNN